MSKKKFLLIFLYSIINLFIILFTCLSLNNFNLITYLLCIQCIVIVLFNYFITKKILLIENVFVLFTYLFHISHAFIVTFGFNDIYAHRSSLAKTSLETYVTAELFIMVCLFVINLGYMIFVKKNKDENQLIIQKKDLIFIRKVSLIVFFVCLIPTLYIDIGKIFALIEGGYLNTYKMYSSGIAKYFYTICKFSRPAISLIIFSYMFEKDKSKKILIISSLYYFIMMLSGDRGTYLIYIITNIFIYFKYIEKLKIKKVLLYCIGIYFAMGFLSSISMFRYSEFSFSSFLNVFSLRKSDGIIYSFLREFGATMTSVIYSFDFIPSYTDYNYGLTYLSSLLNISPKIPTELAEALKNSFAYIYAFPTANQDSLGGSYIGELYFNFGWFGSLISVFVGCFIAKVENALENRKNIYALSVGLVILPGLILWVRDFFCNLLFVPFWFYILLILFGRMKKNESFNNNK